MTVHTDQHTFEQMAGVFAGEVGGLDEGLEDGPAEGDAFVAGGGVTPAQGEVEGEHHGREQALRGKKWVGSGIFKGRDASQGYLNDTEMIVL